VPIKWPKHWAEKQQEKREKNKEKVGKIKGSKYKLNDINISLHLA